MTYGKATRRLLAVAFAVGLSGPALALTCKTTVTTGAADVIKSVATTVATTAWPVRAAALHGVQYANWSNATNKSTSCKLITSPLGVNTWKCDVSAKPCILD